jgi:hypothetical protein
MESEQIGKAIFVRERHLITEILCISRSGSKFRAETDPETPMLLWCGVAI